jgi:hypothetical protein
VECHTLLSKDYTNSSAKLDYLCPNGHTHIVQLGLIGLVGGDVLIVQEKPSLL